MEFNDDLAMLFGVSVASAPAREAPDRASLQSLASEAATESRIKIWIGTQDLQAFLGSPSAQNRYQTPGEARAARLGYVARRNFATLQLDIAGSRTTARLRFAFELAGEKYAARHVAALEARAASRQPAIYSPAATLNTMMTGALWPQGGCMTEWAEPTLWMRGAGSGYGDWCRSALNYLNAVHLYRRRRRHFASHLARFLPSILAPLECDAEERSDALEIHAAVAHDELPDSPVFAHPRETRAGPHAPDPEEESHCERHREARNSALARALPRIAGSDQSPSAPPVSDHGHGQ
jgi:hypothetical protein